MSHARRFKFTGVASVFFIAFLSSMPRISQAVPSYARQTGLPCAACHTTYPELTAFGRNFKLNGYTMTGIQQIESKRKGTAAGVKINQIPPISAMLTASVTQVSKSNPVRRMETSLSLRSSASSLLVKFPRILVRLYRSPIHKTATALTSTTRISAMLTMPASPVQIRSTE